MFPGHEQGHRRWPTSLCQPCQHKRQRAKWPSLFLCVSLKGYGWICVGRCSFAQPGHNTNAVSDPKKLSRWKQPNYGRLVTGGGYESTTLRGITYNSSLKIALQASQRRVGQKHLFLGHQKCRSTGPENQPFTEAVTKGFLGRPG